MLGRANTGPPHLTMDPRARRKVTLLFLVCLCFTLALLTINKWRRVRRHAHDLEDLYGGALVINDHRDMEAHGVLAPAKKWDYRPKQANYGYVSLLCDDSAIPQARVLAYALKKVKSEYPLVFMVLPFVTKTEELVALGAEIEKVPMVPTPFMRANGKRPGFGNTCQYSKIHAWSMTRFEKATYIDTNLLVVNNLDEIFQYEEFSAVKVIGEEFNTALFVLRPSVETHQDMLGKYMHAPPQYMGEQGFLNWYFLNATSHVISSRYNTVVRQKDYAVWPLLKRSAKVFHFTRHTAPWNFYKTRHPDWEQNFEPAVFYYWNQLHHQAMQSLQIEDYNPFTLWSNYKRVGDICNPLTTLYNPKKLSIINKFSVLIGTWDRIPLLRRLILHYQKSRFVHKIYVTWHNPAGRPPEDFLRTVRKKPPVEILLQKYDSLNNRFNPITNLETRAVLIADDDIRVNITDVEYAFEVWKNRPHSLVGVFPRYHYFDKSNSTWVYETRSPTLPRQYSIMLTKFMFMHAEYLYAYTCLLPTRVHHYIDEKVNCEDIAMNMLVTGMTGAKPVAVMTHVDDFGTTSGISLKPGHVNARSKCIADLIRLFGKDTLEYNREVFLPFRKKPRGQPSVATPAQPAIAQT